MPKISFKRHLPILLALLIAAAGAIVVIWVLIPSFGAYGQAREGQRRAEKEYFAAKSRLEDLRAFDKQLQGINPEDIAKLNALFLSSPELPRILTLFETRAQAARFLLTTLEMGEKTAVELSGGPLQEVNIRAQLQGGGYREFKEFLKLLAVSVPLIDITSFTFSSTSANVSFTAKAQRTVGAPGGLLPIDISFFSDPRFKALQSAVALPAVETVGRTNPFAP